MTSHPIPQEIVAFTSATVLPMTPGASRLMDHTVIVRGGRIDKIGPSDQVEVPAGARKIVAKGMTLLPGLCDMHAHIAVTGISPEEGVHTDAEAFRRSRQYLLMFLASGVTTIRNMAGTPLHLELRAAAAEGRITSPVIYSTGPILETTFTFPAMKEFGVLVPTPESARAEVLRQKQAGYDFIKVYNNIDAPIYDEIIRTARQVGMPVIGHVAFAKGLDGALAARQDSIEHLRSYDFAVDTREDVETPERFAGWLHATPGRIKELAERTAEAEVWNVPTLIIDERIGGGDAPTHDAAVSVESPPWLQNMLAEDMLASLFTQRQRDVIRGGTGARLEMVNALDKAGARLMTGSDCPGCQLSPGRSLLQEIEMFARAGIEPLRVLEIATRDAASFLGDDEAGAIKPGMRADLILVEGDPTQDIRAVFDQVGVMLSGKWLTSVDIADELKALEAEAAPA